MSATRTLKLGIALALVALLAACSFTRFAYNQADVVVSWMIDDYFGFEAQQKQNFQKRFDRFHAWHRHEQLPEYAQFMRTAHARVQRELKPDDVLWFLDGMKVRARTAIRHGAPEAAAVLSTLTPAQIEILQRKFEANNRKFVRVHKVNGTAEDRHEAETRRLLKALRDWLLPLTAEQEQRVTALARELPQIQHLRYAERLRRQKEFVALLAHRTEDPARFAARLADWAANWERGRSPEFQKRLDAAWMKRTEILVAVDRMLTPEQRTAYLQRIQGYSNDFTLLAQREGGTAQAAAR